MIKKIIYSSFAFFVAQGIVYQSPYAQETPPQDQIWAALALGTRPAPLSQEPYARVEIAFPLNSDFNMGIVLANSPNGIPTNIPGTYVMSSQFGLSLRYLYSINESFKLEFPIQAAVQLLNVRNDHPDQWTASQLEGGVGFGYIKSRFGIFISERWQQSIGSTRPYAQDQDLSGIQSALEFRIWLPSNQTR